MSAPSSLVFYGLRFKLAPEELTAVEERTDERIVRARKHKLDHYFGNFSEGEAWFLFIGKKLANLGIECANAAEFSGDELRQVLAATEQRLVQAGFEAPARLFAHYQPDL
jgi:hypothetical protein